MKTLLALFLFPLQLSALTIVVTNSGVQCNNEIGGGDTWQCLRAAADVWEACFPGANQTLHVTYEIGPQHGLGAASVYSLDDNADVTVGLARFSSTFPYFIDPTPYANEEFTYPDIRWKVMDVDGLTNGISVNVARRGGNTYHPSISTTYDFFSIALHEMGHMLAFWPNFRGYYEECLDDVLTIAPGLPYAGARMPMSNYGHLALHGTVMGVQNRGVRSWPTEADILGMATIRYWRNANLDLRPTLRVAPGAGGIALSWWVPWPLGEPWLLLETQGQAYPPLPTPPWWVNDNAGRFSAFIPADRPSRFFQLRQAASPEPRIGLAAPFIQPGQQRAICGSCKP